MKKIISFIRLYFYDTPKTVLLLTSLFTAVLIFCNYYFEIDKWINNQQQTGMRFIYRYIISLEAFLVPFLFYRIRLENNYFSKPLIIAFIFFAPAVFALKMSLPFHVPVSPDSSWNHYWNQVIYWPIRLFIIIIILYFIWRRFYNDESFFGLTAKNFDWRPYAIMLLIMVPLIAFASTQPDFLHTYPKYKMVAGDIGSNTNAWLYKLIFELSYGSDFVSIELFFRGFLILGFAKWAGKDSILPMACFYCTIHFGKPLGECISSYFGGFLLGIVVYHTRTILGGLMVHLGIAWLMELGGYLGEMYFRK